MDVRHLLEYWQDSPPVDAVVRAFVLGGGGKGTMHDLAGALGVVVPPPGKKALSHD